MANTPNNTVCENCSCKCWIKQCIRDKDGKVNAEFEELYHERCDTGETFQCYMRENWKACKIMWDALEYYQKLNEEINDLLDDIEIEVNTPTLDKIFIQVKHKLEQIWLTPEQIKHYMNNNIIVKYPEKD